MLRAIISIAGVVAVCSAGSALDSPLDPDLLQILGAFPENADELARLGAWRAALGPDLSRNRTGARGGWELSGTESILGTGNVEGVSSNGSMAVGVAPEGELTVLKWPSPSYDDQVRYLTPMFLGQDTGPWRAAAYNGARARDGIFAGLAYHSISDSGVTWFRSREEDDSTLDDGDPNDDWIHTIRYSSPTSPVVRVESANETLGLRHVSLTVVLPNDQDPFARGAERASILLVHHVLIRAPDSPLRSAHWLFYENAAPIGRRFPAVPLRDQLGDPGNDFAALYHAADAAIVHFRPALPLRSTLLTRPHESQQEIDALVESLDELFGEPRPRHPASVYLAMGARFGEDRFEPAAHQVGDDGCAGPACPIDAFDDAADGKLEGNSFAAPLGGGCNACLAGPVQWRPAPGGRSVAEATFYVAADRSADGARALLRATRQSPPLSHIARAEAWWNELLSVAALPDPRLGDVAAESLIVATAQRALVNIHAATDKVTGAIVASINTQSPYGEDWPRDGSFFNLALDLAGYHELVTQRNTELYPRLARRRFEATWWWPGMLLPVDLRGTYQMNYYADGTVGGPIFFEIDNAALLAWSQWDHYQRLPDSNAARDYLASVTPHLWETARTLARCEDILNGLQCTAFEDDRLFPSQTLHGAITVWTALEAALASADEARRLELPEPPERWERTWRRRRDQLGEAIWQHFWDGEMLGDGGGSSAWALFPARFLDPASPEGASHSQGLMDAIAPHLNLDTAGSSYLAKHTLALAAAGWRGEATNYPGFDLESAQRVLTIDMPTAGSRQYGEVFVNVNDSFDNRTTIPHVWEGALAYVASMLLWPPEEPSSRARVGTLRYSRSNGVGDAAERGRERR